MLLRLTFVVILFVSPACIAGQVLPVGKVLDTVRCIKQPSQSYALYLPSYYDIDRRWPAVIIFEPAARGILAVNRFKKAAEELGYVLMASNNSRNGSWKIALEAAEALLDEISDRYKVDEKRIYTSGFSGGSRVATSVAVITGRVEGVIACGAGLPNVPEYQPKNIHQFSYAALVGNRDMNYQEHIQVRNELNKIGLENNKMVFSGIHEWPPEDHIVLACHWLELRAHKKKLAENPYWDINRAVQIHSGYADSLYAAGNRVLAAEAYEQIIMDFNAIYDLRLIRTRYEEILDSKVYKKQLRAYEKRNDKERRHQSEIMEAFNEALDTGLKIRSDSTVKTADWWYDEIDFLKKVSKARDVEKCNMALRLINLIWAKFATSSFRFSEKGDIETAITFNTIWLRAEPESKWAHWSMAKLMVRIGDVNKVIEHIRAVAANNEKFSIKMIRREPAFASILDDPLMCEMMLSLQ